MKYSIIVVNYNKDETLKKCLDSIINQTVKNFNLIIVDDGSTDNSRKIINEYKKYDNVYIYFKKNTGVSDTRNFAIKKVRTKYFTFVDSDDYIDEKLIETVEKYNNYEILAFSSYKVLRNNKIKSNNTHGTFFIDNGIDAFIRMKNNGKFVLTPWGQIYDIDLFRKNNLKYTVGFVHEDVSLTSMALILAHNVQVIDYYGYYYVQTEHSIMRGNNKEERLYRINSVIYQYRFIKNFLRKNVVDAKKRKDIQRFFSKYMIYYSSKLKRKERKLFFKLLEKDNIFNDFDKNKITYKVYFYFVKHTKYARYMLTAINRLTKQIFTKDKNKTFD